MTTLTTLTANTASQTTTPADEDAAVAALLDGLDITVAETGPATMARRCSTDNGCDTVAGGDC